MWFLCLVYVFAVSSLAKSSAKQALMGPYVIEAKDLSVCNTIEKKSKYFNILKITKYTNDKNQVIFAGNVTVPSRKGPVKARIEGFDLSKKVPTKRYDLKDIPCTNPIIIAFIRMAKVDFDFDKCYSVKGVFQYDNMEVNSLFHKATNVLFYGSIMVRIQLIYPDGVANCFELLVVSKPAT